jgi:hypothetical protein
VEEPRGLALDPPEEARFLKDECPGKEREGQQDQQNDASDPAGLLKQVAQLPREQENCQALNLWPPSENIRFHFQKLP